jgi:AraC-like DNA-binding protein
MDHLTDAIARFDEAAHNMGLHLELPDLFVVAVAEQSIEVDRDDTGRVVCWAREQLGLEQPEDHAARIAKLRDGGASIRAIATRLGMSKSSVQRALSQPVMSPA